MTSKRAKNKMASTNVYRVFKATISWFSGVFEGSFHGIISNARITITHICLSELTFAGFLGRSLNTRPSGLVFKQLFRDPVNVNALKIMFDPYTQDVHGNDSSFHKGSHTFTDNFFSRSMPCL